MQARGQIGKWVVFTFLAIVALGIGGVIFIANNPQNYDSPDPPVFATQTSTGQFADGNNEYFDLVHVWVLVKSNGHSEIDLNTIRTEFWINREPAPAHAVTITKLNNITRKEAATLRPREVFQLEFDVVPGTVRPLDLIEIYFADKNRRAAADTLLKVPQTKEKFEKLFN